MTDIISPAQRLITQISGRRKTPQMSAAIEDTVKALVGFEAELDRAKAGASEAKKKMLKDAADWAEAARASAISKARENASARVDRAREEAESEAEKIREKGDADLRAFESSLSKHRSKAVELAASRLLGETR